GGPASFAAEAGEVAGVEFVPFPSHVAGDLAFGQVEPPGRVPARAEALSGPTTPPGKRFQPLNPPGSEVGPGQLATWGRSTIARSEGFGFKLPGGARASKPSPFPSTAPNP